MSTRSANSNTSQLIIYPNDDGVGADQCFTDLSQPAHLLSDKIRKND